MKSRAYWRTNSEKFVHGHEPKIKQEYNHSSNTISKIELFEHSKVEKRPFKDLLGQNSRGQGRWLSDLDLQL